MQTVTNMLARAQSRFGRLEDDGFLKLFVSERLIYGAATALLSIFVPIFLYETTGGDFYLVGGYYALLSFLYAMLLIPGMYAANRIGFSHALIAGGLFSVLTYSVMFFLSAENLHWLIWPLTIGIVGFRVFHWVPYHVDFALFTKAGERGKQVSISFATISFMGVVGPILSGFIVANAGYNALFGTAVLLLVAATISYVFVPETPTHFDWGWKQTWQEFFSRKRRPVVMGEFANGAETVVQLVVWPIFLYETLNGNVFEIGAVSTVIVGATIAIQLFAGKYLDAHNDQQQHTLRVGSTLYAIGWILKIFVLSALHVFVIGLYHSIVKIFTKTPYSAIIYDISAEQGKYVDEFTVLREMAGALGRASCLVTISLMSILMPIGWTFVLAAAASIMLNVVYRVEQSQ
ncbi:MFS transporter [Candidatus Kaiserbacteria bacterium]|nr:MFS transporter [Candidatus Kaiserbacteria bacterium]